MIESKSHFEGRLRRLGRKHTAMSRGYVTQMRNDGLIVVKPRRRRVHFPLKGIVWMILGFIAFKAFLLSSIGPDAYASRLDTLAQGTLFEQGGAWVMQKDPATQFLSQLVGPVFRG